MQVLIICDEQEEDKDLDILKHLLTVLDVDFGVVASSEEEEEEAFAIEEVEDQPRMALLIDNNLTIEQDQAGFQVIHDPLHPCSDIHGYIPLHRIVVEGVLKAFDPESPFLLKVDGERYLPSIVPIEHIDDDRTNNNPDNLAVCENGDQTALQVKAMQSILDDARKCEDSFGDRDPFGGVFDGFYKSPITGYTH